MELGKRPKSRLEELSGSEGLEAPKDDPAVDVDFIRNLVDPIEVTRPQGITTESGLIRVQDTKWFKRGGVWRSLDGWTPANIVALKILESFLSQNPQSLHKGGGITANRGFVELSDDEETDWSDWQNPNNAGESATSFFSPKIVILGFVTLVLTIIGLFVLLPNKFISAVTDLQRTAIEIASSNNTSGTTYLLYPPHNLPTITLDTPSGWMVENKTDAWVKISERFSKHLWKNNQIVFNPPIQVLEFTKIINYPIPQGQHPEQVYASITIIRRHSDDRNFPMGKRVKGEYFPFEVINGELKGVSVDVGTYRAKVYYTNIENWPDGLDHIVPLAERNKRVTVRNVAFVNIDDLTIGIWLPFDNTHPFDTVDQKARDEFIEMLSNAVINT